MSKSNGSLTAETRIIAALWGEALAMGQGAMWRKRLRDAVAEDSRSQAEIAKAAGISKSHVSDVLGGKGITVDRFLALCQALDKHPVYILTGVEATPRVLATIELLQQLPESEQAEMRRWIERFVRGGERP